MESWESGKKSFGAAAAQWTKPSTPTETPKPSEWVNTNPLQTDEFPMLLPTDKQFKQRERSNAVTGQLSYTNAERMAHMENTAVLRRSRCPGYRPVVIRRVVTTAFPMTRRATHLG